MYIYQISLSTMGFVAQVSEMKRLVFISDNSGFMPFFFVYYIESWRIGGTKLYQAQKNFILQPGEGKYETKLVAVLWHV